MSFADVVATGLPNTDGRRGAADPYVVFSTAATGAELARTEDLRNAIDHQATHARWVGTYVGRATFGSGVPAEVAVTIYDRDSRTGGDERSQLMGHGTFVVHSVPEPPQRVTISLTDVPQGGPASLTLSVGLGPYPPPMPPPVVRREIHSMSELEQRRFIRALLKMMEGPPGVRASPPPTRPLGVRRSSSHCAGQWRP